MDTGDERDMHRIRALNYICEAYAICADAGMFLEPGAHSRLMNCVNLSCALQLVGKKGDGQFKYVLQYYV